MNVNKIATQATPEVSLLTPKSSGAYQILWEIVDTETVLAESPMPDTITISFSTVLPKGTELVFDSMPVNANVNKLPINDSVGGLTVKATVTGLDATQEIHFYMGGIF